MECLIYPTFTTEQNVIQRKIKEQNARLKKEDSWFPEQMATFICVHFSNE